MKKESFLKLLCITASIVVAIGFIAFMFKALHWPVGDLLSTLSTIVTPILLVIQSILMLCYVPKYGALKGSLLAIWRILRCNPFSKGGYDPVP